VEHHDSTEVRAELAQLFEQQINTLEQLTFGGVTNGELSEYDERQKRIYELGQQLTASAPVPRR
jgi:hypothetical protein